MLTFSFIQYLVVNDKPFCPHRTRKIFQLIREQVSANLQVEAIQYDRFSHVKAYEYGSLNKWFAASPHTRALCGKIAAMLATEDLADRCHRRWHMEK